VRYLRFVINNYRAISGPLEIDVEKRSLTPIIGINESGKTTILHAIFAFDSLNDKLNDGRHLRDTANLYRTAPLPSSVQAELEVSRSDLMEAVAALEAADADAKAWWATIRRKRSKLPTKIHVTRHLNTLKYSLDTIPLNHDVYGGRLAGEILRRAPYILFFDDFRDKVDEKIEIPATAGQEATGWLAIIEQLFRQTDKQLSVFQLATLEERQRKSVLAKVQRKLNETLTREWANFRLDDRDALEISVDFVVEAAPNNQQRFFIKLDIVETDASGDKHFFFVSDRSKGFFWFFNFVMKLEFNPKVIEDDDKNTIYLLDEPGSYLHASAQSKLCKKLRSLSDRNRVIYCTHSHYLLDPDVIPLSAIRVADKDPNGNINLTPIFAHKGNILDRRSAFQPVVDALRIKPFILDLTNERVVITEGISDYFALEIFRSGRPIGILPSVGAESIKYYVSLMLAWQVQFWALWDNDEDGRRCHGDATRLFGTEIASRRFRLIPKTDENAKRILQDLFDGPDIRMIREELSLPSNSGFDKTISALYYSPRRAELVGRISGATKSRFEELFTSLELA